MVVFSGDANNDFTVDGMSIRVSNPNTIDYEVKATYYLTVRTTDSGGFLDDALLVINIVSVNDFNPVFTTVDDSITLAEDLTIGSLIFT